MVLTLRHRGPDEFGLYRDPWVGLGSARLSIVDVASGQQPIGSEDGKLWIVYNGEVFNYLELRPGLEARGHRFATQCDTEVILHLYEEFGPACLRQLNGQFAMAIWDAGRRALFLARDRVGIRPLYFAVAGAQLVFGSEIKALLAHPSISAEIDPEALRQVFTYWSPLSPRSIFRGIYELPPGHYLTAHPGQVEVREYWQLDFGAEAPVRSEAEYLEALEGLLVDATTLRLRADVPVGAYLSGGLDSSLIAALIRKHTPRHLDTFSIAFADPNYDESGPQRQMAAFLGTQHQEVRCTAADIGRVFPDVIGHTEAPILRTAPAPMFLLSRLVQHHGYKVVLTGEGADELLAGYDIFKELQIRRFWARRPESKLRPILFRKLYPEIPRLAQNEAFLRAFFQRDLVHTSQPFYSHDIRWANTARTWRFLAGPVRQAPAAGATGDWPVPLPPAYHRWEPLARAQYLEIRTFLSSYLLSSQGDRVAMAHSVEGRYPFLDYRVIEFCNRLPADLKLRGLREKRLLRQLGRTVLPAEIWQRRKRPYRAPIKGSFFAGGAELEYVNELLTPRAIARSGYFRPEAVEKLTAKARTALQLSEVEEMAVVGILSTQLVDHLYVRGARPSAAGDEAGRFKVVEQVSEDRVAA
jgi:asparagine synthase (glutamine-hydrolysing)